MPSRPLPCCGTTEPRHLVDLPHVYQFDFDLFQCPQCSRHWVYAWREGMDGWEDVTPADAAQMQALDGTELRSFMKTWAKDFN